MPAIVHSAFPFSPIIMQVQSIKLPALFLHVALFGHAGDSHFGVPGHTPLILLFIFTRTPTVNL